MRRTWLDGREGGDAPATLALRRCGRVSMLFARLTALHRVGGLLRVHLSSLRTTSLLHLAFYRLTLSHRDAHEAYVACNSLRLGRDWVREGGKGDSATVHGRLQALQQT